MKIRQIYWDEERLAERMKELRVRDSLLSKGELSLKRRVRRLREVLAEVGIELDDEAALLLLGLLLL